MERIGVVVHPRRKLDKAIAELTEWADAHDAEVVQARTPGQKRVIAPCVDAADCDLIVALGGDGTTLAALHTAAAAGKPVLGIACGSLGALAAVTVHQLTDALHRFRAGEWTANPLPALRAESSTGMVLTSLNDLVLVRRGAGQVAIDIDVDGVRYVRYAGDGLVSATPLGSTAYSLASGGPMLAPGTSGIVLTPLAPHGGVCPPLVTAPDTAIDITLYPGFGGARIEVDGQVKAEAPPFDLVEFRLAYDPGYATLVTLGAQESLIEGLRRRRILLDSPRVLIRDERGADSIRG